MGEDERVEHERQQEQQHQEQEAERLRLEEQTRREREEAQEHIRREQDEREKAERAEVQRRAQEEGRKALVEAFLKGHGYNNDVAAPKRTMLKKKYPIHTAAKTGDAQIVAALLEEGANPEQKDSFGVTAAQIAQSKNKKGSHANVLRTLAGA